MRNAQRPSRNAQRPSDAVYLQTKVEAAAGHESFSVRGRQLIRPGWLALYSRSTYEDQDDDEFERDDYDEDGSRTHPPTHPLSPPPAWNASTGLLLPVFSHVLALHILTLHILARAHAWTHKRAGGDIGNLPPLKQGETYPLTEETVPLTERMTSPPSHLSEAELITLMERHGIGTDASIATHINNICERNYVQIAAGKSAEERVLRRESQRASE